MTSYEHAIAATKGARDYQEDTAAFLPLEAAASLASQSDDIQSAAYPNGVGGLAVLADGMGGHTGGALASQTVCAEFLAAATALSDDGADMAMRLKTGLETANGALAAKVDDKPFGPGTQFADRRAWEVQLKARAENQNEYKRVN